MTIGERGMEIGERLERKQSRAALSLHSERRADGHLLIALQGELDLATVDLVAEEVGAAAASDAAQIVLDLSELQFIDSTGIRLLLQLEAESKADGGRLRLTPGSPQVQRVLALTGVDSRLSYVGS